MLDAAQLNHEDSIRGKIELALYCSQEQYCSARLAAIAPRKMPILAAAGLGQLLHDIYHNKKPSKAASVTGMEASKQTGSRRWRRIDGLMYFVAANPQIGQTNLQASGSESEFA